MKHLIGLLAFCASTAAFACPNLSGSYMCEGDKVDVAQAEANGVTTYTITLDGSDIQLVADGKAQTQADQDYTYTTTTSCQGAAVVTQTDVSENQSRSVIASEVTNISMTTPTELTASVVYKEQGQPDYVTQYVCQKQ